MPFIYFNAFSWVVVMNEIAVKCVFEMNIYKKKVLDKQSNSFIQNFQYI